MDFVNALRPVDFRWDLRDDYRPEPPSAPGPEAHEHERTAYAVELEQWRAASTLGALSHDGSRKRTCYHHGLIAQEVAELIARTGLDFGGYQDHTVNGGDDVRSLGYGELIAPLIKAVQELATGNDELRKENAHIMQRLAVLESVPAE